MRPHHVPALGGPATAPADARRGERHRGQRRGEDRCRIAEQRNVQLRARQRRWHGAIWKEAAPEAASWDETPLSGGKSIKGGGLLFKQRATIFIVFSCLS